MIALIKIYFAHVIISFKLIVVIVQHPRHSQNSVNIFMLNKWQNNLRKKKSGCAYIDKSN